MDGSDQIIQAIQGHEWPLVVSLVIFAVCALARDVSSRSGLKGTPAKIISASASYLSGVATALPFVPSWWYSLIAALFTPLASQGLRDLLVDAVKYLAKHKSKSALLVLLFVPMTYGCGACMSERIAVNALDAGIQSVDIENLDDIGVHGENANRMRKAIEIASHAIEIGKLAVESCENISEERMEWRGWFDIAMGAVSEILNILKSSGVEIPDVLLRGIQMVNMLMPSTSGGDT
jgi:hypothetical protein